ncbi:unnamed protein product [Cyprideis torosa]|uniref:Uncharacterized protein n=1 Tax=Cyprideis torosa TaxID=163714 RepID=A0A7R8ZR58_9CRUS|nr:unnamed protein product [Cyprideis torosa]CAG0893531.1 unnamed protein product [Cyprideis torosa]
MGFPEIYLNIDPMLKVVSFISAVILCVLFPMHQDHCPLRCELTAAVCYIAWGASAVILLVAHLNLIFFEKWSFNAEALFVLILFSFAFPAALIALVYLCLFHLGLYIKIAAFILPLCYLLELIALCAMEGYYDYC